MKAQIRRQLSMARRALDFANANPLDDSGFKIALQRLDAAVTRATGLGLQETGGKTGQHSAVAQRKAARRKIRNQLLARVVAVGEEAAKSNPALLGLFDMPPKSEATKPFLLDARTLLALATEHADILIPMGLGETFVADLGAALDQFEAGGTAIDTGRGQHVGASETYPKAMASCRSVIKVIETYYRAAATPDGPVLAGWINARTIEGPFTRSRPASDTPPAPAPSPEPAPTPAPEPLQLSTPARAPAAQPSDQGGKGA